MNKILKSLVVGGLGLMMLPGMVKADTNGTNVTQAGSQSTNVYVNSIEEGAEFNVDIYWDSLEYNYVKSGSEYLWVSVNEGGNLIQVVNNSDMAIQSEISWSAAINGVSATFVGAKNDSINKTCTEINYEELDYGWGGADENGLLNNYTSESGVFYTDANCTIEVEEGTEFSAGTYYQLYSNYISGLGESIAIESQNSAEWMMSLTGGEKSAVEEALAGDKVIGSVTVTISETLVDEG